MMRMSPGGLTARHASQGVAALRQFLVANLFLEGKVDRLALEKAANAVVGSYSGYLQPQSSRPNLEMAASAMCKALLRGGKGAANHPAQLVLATFGISGLVPEDHFILDDIHQIKNGLNDPWKHAQISLPAVLPVGRDHGIRPIIYEKDHTLHPFWLDWYRRAISAQPQNFSLLRDIAAIDDTTWQQGDRPLDREISLITERHELLTELRWIKAELAVAASGPHGSIALRSHNNPPELVEDQAAALLDELSASVDEAERELSNPAPNATRLIKTSGKLSAATTAIIGYCARLGDKALTGMAEEAGTSVGKWVGPALLLLVTNMSPEFRKLVQAVIDFAGTL